MFYAVSDQTFTKQAEGSQVPQVPLHNVDDNIEGSDGADDIASRPSPMDGTWGERDMGGPVNLRASMQEFEDLRQTLSRPKSHRTRRGSHATGAAARRSFAAEVPEGAIECSEDLEAKGTEYATRSLDDEDEFVLGDFLKDGHFEKRRDGASAKKVGVVFRNLTVQGVGATATFVRTLPFAVIGTFGPDLYKNLAKFIPVLPQYGAHAVRRNLIRDFTGVVRDGEMLLVLGRPGSGCSTFLKTIANKREEYAAVLGDVHYGGISAEEQKTKYRGEVNYNEEDDQHFASLTVEQTLQFSLLNKTKKQEKGSIPVIIEALLKMFGITHTKNTRVGDAYIRGVSGGERKRVSIAETLATKSTVVAWDNSTRGLDASTALDYANSLRVMTDISNRTTLVTLYQAGEGIYALMDKVLVIDDGRMVYQGPAKEAKAYFQNLGYYCPDRQTTADFLTSCTDPTERRFREDFDGPIPRGPKELEKAYRDSDAYKQVLQDVQEYERQLEETGHADAREFKEAVQQGKSRTISEHSSYTVSFIRQVLACTRRELWLTMGDKATLCTKFFIIVSIGLIGGSLFSNVPFDTSGAFSRGGNLFFSVVFLGWLQLTELANAVSGRMIIARHKDYAFYRPSAVVIARFLQDLPMVFVQVVTFSVIVYFMTNLALDAGKYFTYVLFIYITTICITAMYRMFASLSPSLDDALRFAGLSFNLLVIFTGYPIPKPRLLSDYIWFGWIYYVNPLSYAFEAVLTNEFSGRTIECAPDMTVPRGAGYSNVSNQGCIFPGAQIGNLSISGTSYVEQSFAYSKDNTWRNFGILIAMTVIYITITAIASELISFTVSGGGALEFKRSKTAQNKVIAETAPNDEEKASTNNNRVFGGSSANESSTTNQNEALQDISGSESVFTWSNIEYTVPYLGGQRKILNGVSGYAKPGIMVALMGASGAGKTTLLNTLAQRQKVGVVAGDMLVDGRPLGLEFQRGTGFCEQMDLHDGTATIREALEFSAILRQERHVPRTEKIAYVDKIIDLLELGEIQDALVRSLGVEQRKRVTIGVELAAKPNLLLFLDEPTSGLDSQSAYSIVRFLKKLSQAGQAIVCTIHQPSSILFQQFDMVLALNPGGNTFYFGPVGENGADVVKYFSDRGVHCPPNKNVAEFILETAAKSSRLQDGKRINWNEEWLKSSQAKEVDAEIKRICDSRSKVDAPPAAGLHEFAAPVWKQTTMLTRRLFVNYWRDPSYIYSKIFFATILGIFVGFSFWRLGNSIADLQGRLFTTFLIILLPPPVVNGVVPKFFQNRSLWEIREGPSKIYGWIAFCTANIVAEIPAAIITATIYWVAWYLPTGLPTDASTSGYVYIMTVIYFLFQASWGQWICAFAPSFTVISNVLPFFFVTFSVFNGVFVPYSQLSVFWRYWMYYANPSTYWIGGVLGSTLANLDVKCAPGEAAYFNPPASMTCSTYASNFVTQYGGYLTNPTEIANCGYCQYSSGVEYLQTLNIQPEDHWRNFGIFLVFCLSNWALVYFFIYTVRVRRWTFGFGIISTGMKTLVKNAKGLFEKRR